MRDRPLRIGAAGNAANEGNRTGQLVAFAARSHRFSLRSRPEVIQPQIDGHDRLEMAKGAPHGRASRGIDQADDGAGCKDSAVGHTDELFPPRQRKLHPIGPRIAIFEAERAAVAYLAGECEEALDIAAELAPFDLKRELSSNRTQGVPNMIALIQGTARRLAG